MPEAESGKEETEPQNRQEENTGHCCKTANLERMRCQAFIFPRIYSRQVFQGVEKTTGFLYNTRKQNDRQGEKKMNELNLNDMEKVNGGVGRTVNTGVQGLNAALRLEPRKSSKQIGSIPNGERVETVTDALIYDPEARRNFVMVSWNGKVGYVASSIVGLPR